ncbi:MAG: prenyltransferase, partial [Alphaproteobacteria bacterium]
MRMVPILTLLRPHQWVKNAFVFPPLFFTPERVSAEAVIAVCLGFVCFCAISSTVYIINDYA